MSNLEKFFNHCSQIVDTELDRLIPSAAAEPARLYEAIRGPGADAQRLLRDGPQVGLYDGRLTIRTIKVSIDGALGSKGAALLENYADHDTNGFLTFKEEQVLPMLKEALRKSIQVETHAIAPHGSSVTLAELAQDAGTIAAEGSFESAKRTYSYGAHAAHVAVDPRTGHVALLDYVAVEDVGRIINPETLHGQSVGAIVQGLGGALLEQLVYSEEGQLLTGSLADYLMPTAGDFPNIRVIALEQYPSPNNPLGAKGAGEGGIIPVGGVIANAVAAALRPLGVEPRELPLSPPRVWQLIQDARSG